MIKQEKQREREEKGMILQLSLGHILRSPTRLPLYVGELLKIRARLVRIAAMHVIMYTVQTHHKHSCVEQ